MKYVYLILTALLITTFTNAQQMHVHKNDNSTVSFNLSEIDSITFSSFTISTDSLVAYYPFNGNANDESGRGNNGTVNGAALASDRFGNANKAYSFNGTSNYISIPDANVFDFSIVKQFSISGWIKRDSTAGSMVISKWGAGMDSDDEWYISVGSGQLSISVNSSINYGSPNLDLIAPNYIPQNTWTHIVLIWNGSGTSGYGALYVNGSLVASNSSTITNIANTSEPIRIGSYGHSNGYYKGVSDDFRIYKRAISESEVQALYHEGGW